MTQGPRAGGGGAMIAPPLGVVTGAVLPGEVAGVFGPASAFSWRGACVGGCGGRPQCREDEPAPECSGCARQRHGVVDDARVPWRPAVHALGAGQQAYVSDIAPLTSAPSAPVNGPVERWTVLRRAVEVSPHDPSLPRTVRQLAESAPGLRVFAAVAVDDAGAVVASVSVRAPGVGYAVYERPEGGAWKFARAAVLAPRPRHRLPARPHLMRANVGRFTAALAGVEYEPATLTEAEPRPQATKGACPSCGAEVSLTKAGAVYASHKCKSKTVEGRS